MNPTFRDLVSLAFSKPTWRLRISYLLKVFIFGPFVVGIGRTFLKKGNDVDSAGEVTDDIYPLF
jgi:hypothetical protein